MLDDISDIDESYRPNNITSHGHNTLYNIHDFMSDRAQTNLAFTAILEQYRRDVMPMFVNSWNSLSEDERLVTFKVNNFFCGLHLLVNFAEILGLFERLQEQEPAFPETSDNDDPGD